MHHWPKIGTLNQNIRATTLAVTNKKFIKLRPIRRLDVGRVKDVVDVRLGVFHSTNLLKISRRFNSIKISTLVTCSAAKKHL